MSLFWIIVIVLAVWVIGIIICLMFLAGAKGPAVYEPSPEYCEYIHSGDAARDFALDPHNSFGPTI